MKTTTILDTRDLQERLDELTAERDTYVADNDGKPNDPDTWDNRTDEWNDSGAEGEELQALEALKDEIGSEWRDGVALIREDGFEDYAREFANDVGAIHDDAQWPCTCIDWERAACELRQDYSETTFRGDIYLYRA